MDESHHSNKQPSIVFNMPDAKQQVNRNSQLEIDMSHDDLRVEDYINGIPDQGQTDILT